MTDDTSTVDDEKLVFDLVNYINRRFYGQVEDVMHGTALLVGALAGVIATQTSEMSKEDRTRFVRSTINPDLLIALINDWNGDDTSDDEPRSIRDTQLEQQMDALSQSVQMRMEHPPIGMVRYATPEEWLPIVHLVQTMRKQTMSMLTSGYTREWALNASLNVFADQIVQIVDGDQVLLGRFMEPMPTVLQRLIQNETARQMMLDKKQDLPMFKFDA